MDLSYVTLSRAQLSYEYLHTNSTTHEFLFGALAELLDNARDASATKINIYSVENINLRGGYMLCFLDDGQGMSSEEARDVIMFGKSSKKNLESQIGMYGNGLKSGSMRIGNDFIMLTKKDASMTCVLLSRTFHEEEAIDEVIVPMPSFDSVTKKPIAKTTLEKEKHLIEMDVITRYSPFKSEAELLQQFDKIDGISGTLVIVYNIKLLDSGEPELDVKSVSNDIVLSNPGGSDFDTDEGLMPERKSFRAYTSILYIDPRMRVYIQGVKVHTKRLANCLYKPKLYRYSSSRFKHRSELDAKKAMEEAKNCENKAKEAESKARNLEIKLASSTDKEQRSELRRIQQIAFDLRKETNIKKIAADRKNKLLRDPKNLVFVFGLNLDSRQQDGVFVYNCSRLIKMYQKIGAQADGGVFCSGVVGYVDVPYLVLEPTHNKQDFADAKEYRHLLQALGEHMVQYWKDVNIVEGGVTKFWESYGYVSPNWKDPPSFDSKFLKKRAMQVPTAIQCDLCLKWRILPFSSNNIGKNFPDDWVCNMNPDPSHNRCSIAEEKLNLPEGTLKRAIKSIEEKGKNLEQEIKRKKEMLQKINKKKKLASSSEEEFSEDEEEEKPQNKKKLNKTIPTALQATSRQQQQQKQQVNREASRLVSHPPASTRKRAVMQQEEEESEEEQIERSTRKKPTINQKIEKEVKNQTPPTRISVQPTEANTSPRTSIPLRATNVKEEEKNEPDDGHPTTSTPKPTNSNQTSSRTRKSDVNKSEDKLENAKLNKKNSHQEVAPEVPTSSSGLSDDIANGYRTCLRYFLPPKWTMDKESVSGLSLNELAIFPLEQFFDKYEQGLKELVGTFQLDLLNKSNECEQIKETLLSLRKLIAKLLKSINEDFELDPEGTENMEQVDELLAFCVKQALQSNANDDTQS